MSNQQYSTVNLEDAESAESSLLTDDKKSNHDNGIYTKTQITSPKSPARNGSRRSRILQWTSTVLGTMLFLFLLLLCIILIGARIEQRAYNLAPSTLPLYETSDVCAMTTDDKNKNIHFSTFPIAKEAHVDGYKVAHCGSCGKCSNLHDIDIQVETTNTLTSDSTACAFLIFTGGSRAVHQCLQDRVGFTKPCEDCWVDDIECNVRHCKYTCIKVKYLFRDMSVHNELDGELNDCLLCDEKMCGPRFLECSGSNRRRLGLVSDIGRDSQERCKVVDSQWAI